MISSYPHTVRRQLLSKHFLISTIPERALDDLVRFSTVAHFEPHQDIVRKGEPGDCLYGIFSGRVRIYSTSPEGSEILLNVMGTRGALGRDCTTRRKHPHGERGRYGACRSSAYSSAPFPTLCKG